MHLNILLIVTNTTQKGYIEMECKMMSKPKFPDQSHSIWFEETSIPTFEPLTEDLTTDVVIIGGGITGITAAYLLSQQILKSRYLKLVRY